MYNLKFMKILFALALSIICLLIISCNFTATYTHNVSDQLAASEHVGRKLMSRNVYVERLENLNKICNRLNYSSYTEADILNNRDLLDHIIIDSKHRLLYCYVPKVACTNWKRIFTILTGATNYSDVFSVPANMAHNKSVLLTLGNVTQETARYLLNTYTKFLFVRHPFERLLSAYRNKLDRNYIRSKYFQSRVGRYIIKTVRAKPKNSSLQNGDDVTFEEFTDYLSKSPIEEFNEHWKPINNLCEPCLIKYHFIGKYETLLSDAHFILKTMGISNTVRFPQNVKPATNYDDLKKYFSSFPPSKIYDLYRIYEKDFKLFSYSLEQLLGYEVG